MDCISQNNAFLVISDISVVFRIHIWIHTFTFVYWWQKPTAFNLNSSIFFKHSKSPFTCYLCYTDLLLLQLILIMSLLGFFCFIYSVLWVYLRERSHVPETTAWLEPDAGPEFDAEMSRGPGPNLPGDPLLLCGVEQKQRHFTPSRQQRLESSCSCRYGVPVLSKVKMSPSHLAALFGVLGSELQLERRRVFLLGELGSSADVSSSG